MAAKFDLLIFDLDGTIIDNRMAIRANFNYALHTHGYPEVDTAAIDKTIGIPLEEAFILLSPGMSLDTAIDLRKTYSARYSKTCGDGTVLLEGIPEILVEFRAKGIKLAIATTKGNEVLQILLSKINLLQYFDLAVGRIDGLKMKPEPDMLNYIMEKLNVSPDRTAMIGDTYVDILTGRNAGVFSIGVLSGVKLGFASKEKLEEAKPDATIQSLTELRKLVGVH